MSMQPGSRVPEIRFKGFEEIWVEKSLAELCEPLTYGLNAAATGFDGENKYLRITDIDDESRAFLQTGLTSPKADLAMSQGYILEEGDIVFARTGASVGKTYLYKNGDGRVFFAGFLIRARTSSGENANFIFQSTLTEHYEKFVKLTSQRSGQPGINAREYSSFSFHYPTNPTERNQIGEFFKELDRMIELHQHKQKKLVTLKQAMLQKMFPQDGVITPEIRFKGFEKDWEKSTLGEGTSLLTGHPFEGKKFSNQGILLVRGMNVKRGYLDSSKRTSEYWASSFGYECFLLQEDDIVIQMDGALIGKSYAKIRKTNLPALLVQRVTRVRCSKTNCDFVYQYIQRNFLAYINSTKTETAVPHLSLNDIRVFSIMLPNNAEQKKIGTYFRHLDNLISQHATQLEKLKQIKSACVEKMFV